MAAHRLVVLERKAHLLSEKPSQPQPIRLQSQSRPNSTTHAKAAWWLEPPPSRFVRGHILEISRLQVLGIIWWQR